jgi:hypothetical protein
MGFFAKYPVIFAMCTGFLAMYPAIFAIYPGVLAIYAGLGAMGARAYSLLDFYFGDYTSVLNVHPRFDFICPGVLNSHRHYTRGKFIYREG